MKFHEAANILPLDEAGIDDLANDIRAHGQQVAIEVLDGAIIDGRRRWLACAQAGVAPAVRDVTVQDPVAHVLSLNLHRRQLTPSQKAMVGARAQEFYDRRAKERQQVRKGNQPGATQENLPDLSTGQARDQVGKAVGVSGKSIDHATRVLEQAVPEVVRAVDEGRMAVSTAAALAAESAATQRAQAARPKRRRRSSPADPPPADPPPVDPKKPPAPPAADAPTDAKMLGVGVIRANEAIDCLIRIPKNDALRKRGFQIVTDWIQANR